MLALEAVDHLASPFGPEQTCAVFHYWILVLKFQIELKDHKALRKVMCLIWCSIQVKIL
jgi:hypothetical protein